MTKEITLDQLAEVVGEVVDLSGVQVREDAVLGDDIPVDSREMLRVVSRVESTFGAKFTPRDLLRAKTLGDLLEITRQRAATHSG